VLSLPPGREWLSAGQCTVLEISEPTASPAGTWAFLSAAMYLPWRANRVVEI